MTASHDEAHDQLAHLGKSTPSRLRRRRKKFAASRRYKSRPPYQVRCDCGAPAVCKIQVRFLNAELLNSFIEEMNLCLECLHVEKEMRRSAGDPPPVIAWLQKK